MQATLWTMAATATGVAGLAAFADRRRARRQDPDRIGWVPWPMVLIGAIICAAICVALALRQ